MENLERNKGYHHCKIYSFSTKDLIGKMWNNVPNACARVQADTIMAIY